MSSTIAALDRSSAPPGGELGARYAAVRAHTEALAASLSPEDQCVQSMEDASPAKWHRAHTTWFFEEFVAKPHIAGYVPFDPRFGFLFNSYYEAMGARHPRPARGLLTRPSADEVGAYRRAVDAALLGWLDGAPPALAGLVTLGLHHEQQHQELLQTDILHAMAQSPLAPAAIPGWREPQSAPGETRFIDLPGGIASIGHRGGAAGGPDGFAFDNETPRHRVLLQPGRLASHLVRNGEWRAFMADGGYGTAALWMAEGWDMARSHGWSAPFHWRQTTEGWRQMTLGGLVEIDDAAPVRHLSWYEADAYARWAGARLPTEAELEVALAGGVPGALELTGHVWQWTNSAYLPYPRFRPPPGAVGEYNGKFMINQMVLRGGSSVTPPGHARPTYRNFFPPDKRWQFTGLRLARD
jgi:ergothioneine biosynthesis protein EgtB